MHQFKRLIALCWTLCLLTGCNQIVQVEDLAYAIVLGIDLTSNEQIQLTIQVPKITGNPEGESTGGNESDSLYFSASGETFVDALTALQWAVPRRMDLSQLELIIFSEKVAQSDMFSSVSDAIINTARLYSASRVAVCQGEAAQFMTSLSASIGSSTATDLSAMFANYIERGFIPDVTFADVYYKTHSIYSDPLAIYGLQYSEETAAASMIVPKASEMDSIESNRETAFLGAAVFHDQKMITTLNSQQLQYCLLLRGSTLPLAFNVDQQMILLKQSSRPKIHIDVDSSPVSIDLQLKFTVLPDSDPIEIDGLEDALRDGLRSTIEYCQQLGCEPFAFAEIAARKFLTFSDWNTFRWHDRFQAADIHIDLTIQREDL